MLPAERFDKMLRRPACMCHASCVVVMSRPLDLSVGELRVWLEALAKGKARLINVLRKLQY